MVMYNNMLYGLNNNHEWKKIIHTCYINYALVYDRSKVVGTYKVINYNIHERIHMY